MPHRPPKYPFLIYVASFVFPFFGLVYGMLALAKPERTHKQMGKRCVVLGIISIMVICLGSLFFMAVNVYGGFGPAF